MIEHRRPARGSVRAKAEGRVDAVVCTYNAVDDYGSVWTPGVWTESLRTRLPKVTWAHDWQDVIGRVVAVDDDAARLAVTLQLSDFDAVPRARQAWVQLRDGDIDQFSFGFERNRSRPVSDAEAKRWPGAKEVITAATMHEVSPVLVGAVPGTGVLAVRAGEMTVGAADLADVARRLAAGQINLAEAEREIAARSRRRSPQRARSRFELEAVDAEATAALAVARRHLR